MLTVQSKREEPVSVFFAQSDLDSACGLHVLAMILVIFDLAKSCALVDMNRRKFGVPAAVFAAFKHTYFTGVHAPEFMDIVESLGLPLSLKLRKDTDGCVDAFVVDCLMRGALVAIAIASVKNRRTKHWVLCIGVEGNMSGRDAIADGLLLLDPGASEPNFRAYNARLCLPKEGRGASSEKLAEKLHQKVPSLKPIHWCHESPDWATEPVRLMAAVSFRLSE